MKIKVVVGLFAILALIGCDQQAWFEKFISKEDAEFSIRYLALLQARNFPAIERKIDPRLKNAQLRSELKQIAAFFPAEKPIDIEVVGAHTFSSSAATDVNITLQYAYPSKWLLANVVFQKKDGNITVMGINVQPLPDSVENINRFTFKGKGAIHYMFFTLAIIVPLFIVTATVLCIKTSIPKRKWLWVLFVLCGYAQITLNWSDGSLNINPIHFQILGAGFIKYGPYAPWMLTVSIPIGAIAFLKKRKKWIEQANMEPRMETPDERADSQLH